MKGGDALGHCSADYSRAGGGRPARCDHTSGNRGVDAVARPTRFVLRPLSRREPGSFANAIVVLYSVSALLGAVLYLSFRVHIRPDLERAGHWPALGVFDLKEHFVSIGLALLPAYWVCWRQQRTDHPCRTPAALTLILAFIVWWSFLIGHVLNNIMGFGDDATSMVSQVRICIRNCLCDALRGRGRARPRAVHRLSIDFASCFWALIIRETAWGRRWGGFMPAMYWYGWTATAALGALIFGIGAAFLPERWSRPFWSGWLWVIPVAAMIGCVYLTLPWFRL